MTPFFDFATKDSVACLAEFGRRSTGRGRHSQLALAGVADRSCGEAIERLSDERQPRAAACDPQNVDNA